MVLCFGEILLRLAPDEHSEWLEKSAINIYPGGAEMNVAAALAKWRVPVSYCTAAPKNFLSTQVIKNLEKQNIGVSTIIYSGHKIGLYYLLQGTEIQHAEVIYDRSGSSFAELKPGTINWDKVLDGIRWFHFSAITPALSNDAAAICKEALQVCMKKNIFVSVDLKSSPQTVAIWQAGK